MEFQLSNLNWINTHRGLFSIAPCNQYYTVKENVCICDIFYHVIDYKDKTEA